LPRFGDWLIPSMNLPVETKPERAESCLSAMIAPLKSKPERHARAVSSRLAAARGIIAALFLPAAQTVAPPIAGWKAWLFVAWMAMTLIFYALAMSGLIEN
jgi:hypothetical protein